MTRLRQARSQHIEHCARSTASGRTPLVSTCRQCLFGGLRIGLYDPVKALYVGKDHKGDVPFHLKVAAGLTTGAAAICIASPTDLVKVRMQAEGKLPDGVPKKYPSAMAAYRIIAKCAVRCVRADDH